MTDSDPEPYEGTRDVLTSAGPRTVEYPEYLDLHRLGFLREDKPEASKSAPARKDG